MVSLLSVASQPCWTWLWAPTSPPDSEEEVERRLGKLPVALQTHVKVRGYCHHQDEGLPLPRMA